jgi:transposase
VVLDAILYIARTGCQRRMLPKDFPPFTMVQGYFYECRDDSLFEKINLLQAREAAGREASPSAAGSSNELRLGSIEPGGWTRISRRPSQAPKRYIASVQLLIRRLA